jgi:glutaredoxin
MRLIIYSKPGCHLCDEMKLLVHRVIGQQSNNHAIALDEIDISNHRELLDRYGLEIPVLLIDGAKVAKYRVSETELRQMLEARRGQE